jgi:hypothetical protein
MSLILRRVRNLPSGLFSMFAPVNQKPPEGSHRLFEIPLSRADIASRVKHVIREK